MHRFKAKLNQNPSTKIIKKESSKMKKRIFSIILSVIMLLTAVPFAASAADFMAKDVVSNLADIALDTVSAAATPKNKEVSAFVDFFRTIFGLYKIGNESRLKKAASEGGDKWTIKKDFTIDSQITITCASLKIDGKNHTISMKNGKNDSAILKVLNHKETWLNNLTLKNDNGYCVIANTYTKLIIGEAGKCSFESKGDTIVNYGYTQLSSGTILKTTGTNSYALRNMKTDKNEISEATLYCCNVNKIINDGKLNLTQSNTVVGSVINNGTVNMRNGNNGDASKAYVSTVSNNSGAVWNLISGHIGTFENYGSLNKTGGTIDTMIPAPTNYDKKVAAFLVDPNYRGNTTPWKDSTGPYLSDYNAYGCCAYCVDFLKYVYGYNDYASHGTKFTNAADIKTGDILKFVNDQHWIVVLHRNGNSLHVAERWGEKIIVTDGTYTIKNGKIYRNGSVFRTFSYGYHYDIGKALAK